MPFSHTSCSCFASRFAIEKTTRRIRLEIWSLFTVDFGPAAAGEEREFIDPIVAGGDISRPPRQHSKREGEKIRREKAPNRRGRAQMTQNLSILILIVA
jgi:hypothetical protein